MKTEVRYPKEVRERAVRMVFDNEERYDSRLAAITSIAGKLGMMEGSERRRPGLGIHDRSKGGASHAI